LRGAAVGALGGGRQMTEGVDVRCDRCLVRDFFIIRSPSDYLRKFLHFEQCVKRDLA
jgi:hypothetical protein